MTASEWFVALRKKHQLTAEQMAHCVGLTITSIYSIESNPEYSMKFETLRKAVMFFKPTHGELLQLLGIMNGEEKVESPSRACPNDVSK